MEITKLVYSLVTLDSCAICHEYNKMKKYAGYFIVLVDYIAFINKKKINFLKGTQAEWPVTTPDFTPLDFIIIVTKYSSILIKVRAMV